MRSSVSWIAALMTLAPVVKANSKDLSLKAETKDVISKAKTKDTALRTPTLICVDLSAVFFYMTWTQNS